MKNDEKLLRKFIRNQILEGKVESATRERLANLLKKTSDFAGQVPIMSLLTKYLSGEKLSSDEEKKLGKATYPLLGNKDQGLASELVSLTRKIPGELKREEPSGSEKGTKSGVKSGTTSGTYTVRDVLNTAEKLK